MLQKFIQDEDVGGKMGLSHESIHCCDYGKMLY